MTESTLLLVVVLVATWYVFSVVSKWGGLHHPCGRVQIRVEDLIVKELQKSSDHLNILMETGLTTALEGFVLKNESHAIEGVHSPWIRLSSPLFVCAVSGC